MGLEITENGDYLRYPSTSPAPKASGTPVSSRFGSPTIATEPWTGTRVQNADESVVIKQGQTRRRRTNQKAKPSYFDSEDSLQPDEGEGDNNCPAQDCRQNPAASSKRVAKASFFDSDPNDPSPASPPALQSKQTASASSQRGLAQQLLDSSPPKSRCKDQAGALSPSNSGEVDDIVVPAISSHDDECFDDAHADEPAAMVNFGVAARCPATTSSGNSSKEDQVPDSQKSNEPFQDQASTACSPVLSHNKDRQSNERQQAMKDEGKTAQIPDRKKRTLSFLSMPASTTSDQDSPPKRPKLSRAMRGNSMLEMDHKVQTYTQTTVSTEIGKRGNKVALSALELEDEGSQVRAVEDIFDHVNVPPSGGQSPPTAQRKSRSTKNTKSKKATAAKMAKPTRKPKARIAKLKGKPSKASPPPNGTASLGQSAAEDLSNADVVPKLLVADISNASGSATIQPENVVSGSPSNLNLKSTQDIATLLSDFGDDFADNFDFSLLEITKAESKTSSAEQQVHSPKGSDIVRCEDEKPRTDGSGHNPTTAKRDLSARTTLLGPTVEDGPSGATVALREESNIVSTDNLPRASQNPTEVRVNIDSYIPASPVALGARTEASSISDSQVPATISHGSITTQHASTASKQNSPATGENNSAMEVEVVPSIGPFTEEDNLRACLTSMDAEPCNPVKPLSAIEDLDQHANLAETAPCKTTKYIQPDIVTVGSEVISDNDELCKDLAQRTKPNALPEPTLDLHTGCQQTSTTSIIPTLQQSKNKSTQSQSRKSIILEHEGLTAAGCRLPLNDVRHVRGIATQTEIHPSLLNGTEYQSRLGHIPNDNQVSRKIRALSEPDEPTSTGPRHIQHTWPAMYELSASLGTAARQNGAVLESDEHGLPKIMQNGIVGVDPSRPTLDIGRMNSGRYTLQEQPPSSRDTTRSREVYTRTLPPSLDPYADKTASEFLSNGVHSGRSPSHTQVDKSSEKVRRSHVTEDTRNQFYRPLSSANEDYSPDQISAHQVPSLDCTIMKRLRAVPTSQHENMGDPRVFDACLEEPVADAAQHGQLATSRLRNYPSRYQGGTKTCFGPYTQTEFSPFTRADGSSETQVQHDKVDHHYIHLGHAGMREHGDHEIHSKTMGSLMHQIVEGVLRELKAREDPIHDVVNTYRTDGNKIVQGLFGTHANEQQRLVDRYEQSRLAYMRGCEGARKRIRSLAASLQATGFGTVAAE